MTYHLTRVDGEEEQQQENYGAPVEEEELEDPILAAGHQDQEAIDQPSVIESGPFAGTAVPKLVSHFSSQISLFEMRFDRCREEENLISSMSNSNEMRAMDEEAEAPLVGLSYVDLSYIDVDTPPASPGYIPYGSDEEPFYTNKYHHCTFELRGPGGPIYNPYTFLYHYRTYEDDSDLEEIIAEYQQHYGLQTVRIERLWEWDYDLNMMRRQLIIKLS